jgi:mRNA-degrading endonuclease RelE of RelBE toxin-antitoxin system
MTYSYERTASGFTDLKSLSPKFYQALKKAISEEKIPKVKDALKEALGHFEQVIDNLKVAEHEDEDATRE